MSASTIEAEVKELREQVGRFASSLTILVNSHAETKDVLQSLSSSMASLVEMQINTQNNTKNIGKLFDKQEKSEDDVSEIKASIYQSCDTKTKEVDDKLAIVKGLFFKVIAGLVAVGISYIGYSELKMTKIEVKQAIILEKISEINKKLDKATAQRYYLQKELKEAK